MVNSGIFKRPSFPVRLLAAFGAVFVIIILIAIALWAVSGGPGRGKRVAVIKLGGVIEDSLEISRQLDALGERSDVRAVVLRIDSPGGAVGPSQEIYRSVKKLAEKKPVVASMGSVAASGGFYAAMAADRIVANPGTITGSIGVLIEFVNASELLKKLGLRGYVIKSGRFKDVGSPMRKMNEDERRMLQKVIDDVNEQFVKAVAEGRKLKVSEVRKIADGRIFTGAQAKKIGLVDRLGNIDDAIELGANLAGIKGRPGVIYPERGFNLWQSLLGSRFSALITDLARGLRIMYLMPFPHG